MRMSRCSFASFLLAFAACTGHAPDAKAPSALSIEPAAASVGSGATIQFKATAGAETAFKWTVAEGASGGSVDANGLYTAPDAEGTYHVLVTTPRYPSVSAAAVVTVASAGPGGGASAVTITPQMASTAPGTTVNFSAAVSGDPNAAILWSVQEGDAGGKITGGGTYTAPAAEGKYHVVATYSANPFRSAVATIFVRVVSSGSAAPPMGAGLEPIVDWGRTNAFVDLVKQSRGFGTAGSADPSNPVPLDELGWPTTDFGIILWTSAAKVHNLGGTYKLSCHGSANIAPLASDAVVQNVVYTAATDTTTADVVVREGSDNLWLSFTGTNRGVRDLKVIRPGYRDTDTFTTPLKNQLSRFGVIRFMDWENTNNNPVQHWSERSKPTDPQYSKNTGVPWEVVIRFANELHKDPWINIPIGADDDYVRQLAALFKAQLDPSIHVWVEYSNEVWNGQFKQFQTNVDLANADVARGGSPLNADGEKDQYVWAWRRVALRLKQISDLFASVYGASAINTTVRPVLAGQVVGPYIARQGLDLIQRVYGRPNQFFYAIAGAPYFDMGADNDITTSLTLNQVIAALSRGVDQDPIINAYAENAALARWYNLPFVAYEGGPDTFGPNNVASKKAAQFDPRMKELVQRYLTTWFSYGFGLFNWFVAGATPYDTPFGTWGLTDDMSNLDTPKLQGIDAVLAAGPVSVIAGAGVPSTVDARGYAGAQTSYTDPYLTGLGRNDTRDYLVHVPVEGDYSVSVSVANAWAGPKVGILVDGSAVATQDVPVTGSAQTFQFLAPVRIHLTAGMNVVRLQAVVEGFNVQSLRFGQ